jgi:hypothetical protein
MIARLFDASISMATWPAVSILVVLLIACIQGSSWRQQTLGHDNKLLDSRRWYTPAEARNLFERLGKSGRNLYALTELTLDLVFPLIYGSLFCLLTASLARAQWAWLVTIPLFAALSDLVENSIVAYLAWSYAGQESSLAWLAAAVTLIKTILLGLSLLILFAGGAYGLLLSSPPAAGR